MSSALQLTRLTLDLTRSKYSDTLNSSAIQPISSEMIQNLSIMDEDISANAGISGSKIANSSISLSKMENVSGQTFQNYLISLGASPGSGTITSDMIANGTIVTNDISDGQITSDKIANGTIMNVDISANADISGSKIADGSITYNKLNSNITSLISTLTTDLAALTIRVSALENPGGGGGGGGGGGDTGWYGTILFTFNTNAAVDFVLNIDGYASNVSINTSTNTWTLPIGSRLATTSTLLPPIQIYPFYSYMITDVGFMNGNITFSNSPPFGYLIPTNLYNTIIEYNMTTIRD